MANKAMTGQEIEQEISRLRHSPYVELACRTIAFSDASRGIQAARRRLANWLIAIHHIEANSLDTLRFLDATGQRIAADGTTSEKQEADFAALFKDFYEELRSLNSLITVDRQKRIKNLTEREKTEHQQRNQTKG